MRLTLRGLPAVTGIISPYTGQDISSTYHMDPTGIPVPDGNHVGPNGSLVADFDPSTVNLAKQLLATINERNATIAHMRAALAQPGLSPAQTSFANGQIATWNALVPANQNTFSQLPAYAQQAAQSWLNPNALVPDNSGASSGQTIQQIIDLNNRIFDNQLAAYADPATVAQLASQAAAIQASANAAAAAIAQAVGSGTSYTLPGAAPIPAQYQPQNLPAEPVHASSGNGQQAAANAGTSSNPILNLTSGHTTAPALPNIVGTANGTAPPSQQVTPQDMTGSNALTEQLQTMYGPLPLWGWVAGGAAALLLFGQMGHKK